MGDVTCTDGDLIELSGSAGVPRPEMWVALVVGLISTALHLPVANGGLR